MGEERYLHGFGVKAEGKMYLAIFRCRWMMLRWILKKSFGKTWTGLIQLKIGINFRCDVDTVVNVWIALSERSFLYC